MFPWEGQRQNFRRGQSSQQEDNQKTSGQPIFIRLAYDKRVETDSRYFDIVYNFYLQNAIGSVVMVLKLQLIVVFDHHLDLDWMEWFV